MRKSAKRTPHTFIHANPLSRKPGSAPELCELQIRVKFPEICADQAPVSLEMRSCFLENLLTLTTCLLVSYAECLKVYKDFGSRSSPTKSRTDLDPNNLAQSLMKECFENVNFEI